MFNYFKYNLIFSSVVTKKTGFCSIFNVTNALNFKIIYVYYSLIMLYQCLIFKPSYNQQDGLIFMSKGISVSTGHSKPGACGFDKNLHTSLRSGSIFAERLVLPWTRLWGGS